jgi:selenophosphate synthase
VEYDGCPDEARFVLNDAQTSGGLLISLPPDKVKQMQQRLKEAEYPYGMVEIGKVVAGHPGKIKVVCR